MNIVSFFKFVFIAIGHPPVFFVYLYIRYKVEVLPKKSAKDVVLAQIERNQYGKKYE